MLSLEITVYVLAALATIVGLVEGKKWKKITKISAFIIIWLGLGFQIYNEWKKSDNQHKSDEETKEKWVKIQEKADSTLANIDFLEKRSEDQLKNNKQLNEASDKLLKNNEKLISSQNSMSRNVDIINRPIFPADITLFLEGPFDDEVLGLKNYFNYVKKKLEENPKYHCKDCDIDKRSPSGYIEVLTIFFNLDSTYTGDEEFQGYPGLSSDFENLVSHTLIVSDTYAPTAHQGTHEYNAILGINDRSMGRLTKHIYLNLSVDFKQQKIYGVIYYFGHIYINNRDLAEPNLALSFNSLIGRYVLIYPNMLSFQTKIMGIKIQPKKGLPQTLSFMFDQKHISTKYHLPFHRVGLSDYSRSKDIFWSFRSHIMSNYNRK